MLFGGPTCRGTGLGSSDGFGMDTASAASEVSGNSETDGEIQGAGRTFEPEETAAGATPGVANVGAAQSGFGASHGDMIRYTMSFDSVMSDNDAAPGGLVFWDVKGNTVVSKSNRTLKDEESSLIGSVLGNRMMGNSVGNMAPFLESGADVWAGVERQISGADVPRQNNNWLEDGAHTSSTVAAPSQPAR